MPVNPLKIIGCKSSVVGIKETLRHLSDGKPLGMFPAGEVSSYKDGNTWLTNHGKKQSKSLEKPSSCCSHLFSC
jgi:hypothetical protein